jgi:transglutaminase-like putative cysteine protease
MGKKLALTVASIGVAGITAVYLLSLPMLRRLPKQSHVTMDGVTSIADAVAACRQSHLQGWELVAYAQHLVARKFTYSRLNTWDTPSRAFERGLGYCEQQALSLKHIYDQLGIQARGMFCLRCTFPPKVVDGIPSPGGTSGHAWLRVKIGDEERDVCPSSVNNTQASPSLKCSQPSFPGSPGYAPSPTSDRPSKTFGATSSHGAA